jgi:hypothetical protein
MHARRILAHGTAARGTRPLHAWCHSRGRWLAAKGEEGGKEKTSDLRLTTAKLWLSSNLPRVGEAEASSGGGGSR